MGEIIAAMIVGVLVGCACTFALMQYNFDNGYCAASGGTRIAAGMCNVNGKVVEVK
jgi:hypothetical protein